MPRLASLLSLAILFLATGCTTQLGAGANNAALVGTVSQERIFDGGPVQNHTRVQAASLQSGKSYAARGKLTVEGDVPPDTDITVELGKLVVTGDVGAGSKLRVNVPVVSHSEYRFCQPRGPAFGYGYGGYGSRGFSHGVGLGYDFGPPGYYQRDCSATVVDGLLYDDSGYAVDIRGKLAGPVDIRTYGRVRVGGAVQPNPYQMSPYRPR